MADEQHRGGIGGIGDGIRTGFGILNAFREAIEETLQEAVDRGDLSPDRARRAVKDAAERIQLRLDDVRDRIDLVSRREFDELRGEVETLRGRVARLEGVPRLSEDPGPAGDVTATD